MNFCSLIATRTDSSIIFMKTLTPDHRQELQSQSRKSLVIETRLSLHVLLIGVSGPRLDERLAPDRKSARSLSPPLSSADIFFVA